MLKAKSIIAFSIIQIAIGSLLISCSKNSDYYAIENDFLTGVAPIPANFPGTQTDWLNMFELIDECSSIVTAQNPWRDSIETSGEIPDFIKLIHNQQSNHNYEILYGINFFEQKDEFKALLETNNSNDNSWNNNEAKLLYRELAKDIIRKYNPKYLALGLEVNSYYSKNPEDFFLFVNFYSDLYDELKRESPSTMIFVTFQLEMLNGIGDDTWGFEIDNQWDIIDLFNDKLDLLVLTTYPEVEFSSVENIPDNYYSDLSNYTNKTIAFSEIGWSSNIRGEGEQVDFAKKLLSQIENCNIEFVNWIFMHDLPGAGPLTKTGFRKSNGKPKEIWFFWKTQKK